MDGGNIMEEKTQVFVFISPEVQETLADNAVDLIDLINQEGVQVKRGFAQNPSKDRDSAYKEPTSVILASAALVLALAPIIKKVISALSHKEVLVNEMVLVPVEDSSGNVVRDNSGNPILHWIRKTKIIESSKEPQDISDISVKGPFGFELTFSDLPKE